jgi:hypothetical protein
MICPLNGSVKATQSPHVLPVGTVSSSRRDMTDPHRIPGKKIDEEKEIRDERALSFPN